jgi:hypothetical protein
MLDFPDQVSTPSIDIGSRRDPTCYDNSKRRVPEGFIHLHSLQEKPHSEMAQYL